MRSVSALCVAAFASATPMPPEHGTTLVIFASDHGTELFDHGINNDKHNFLDASLRVPLILRGAGLPAGETREFATTLDITATILAAAAAGIPNEYQGFDLVISLELSGVDIDLKECLRS